MSKYYTVERQRISSNRPQHVNTSWTRYEVSSNEVITGKELRGLISGLFKLTFSPAIASYKIYKYFKNKELEKNMEDPKFVAKLRYEKELKQKALELEQQKLEDEKLQKEQEFENQVQEELEKLRKS